MRGPRTPRPTPAGGWLLSAAALAAAAALYLWLVLEFGWAILEVAARGAGGGTP